MPQVLRVCLHEMDGVHVNRKNIYSPPYRFGRGRGRWRTQWMDMAVEKFYSKPNTEDVRIRSTKRIGRGIRHTVPAAAPPAVHPGRATISEQSEWWWWLVPQTYQYAKRAHCMDPLLEQSLSHPSKPLQRRLRHIYQFIARPTIAHFGRSIRGGGRVGVA